MAWRSVTNPFEPVRVLSDDHVEHIHLSSLRLLAGTGMRVLHAGARDVLAAAGCEVDDVVVRFDPDLIDEVIARAQAFAEAGAGSLFVPFLGDHPTIATICERAPLPVNVLWAPGRGTRDELAALGVARISYGHGPWAAAMAWLGEQAKAVFAGEVVPYGR